MDERAGGVVVFPDDAIVREAVVPALERRGLDVRITGDAEEILALREDPAAVAAVVVLLDGPRVLDLLEALVRRGRFDPERVLVLAAEPQPFWAQGLEDLGFGAQPYLPVASHDLAERLARVLAAEASRRAPRFAVALDAELDDGETAIPARAENLGTGGTFLALDGPMPAGSPLVARIRLGESAVEAEVDVRHQVIGRPGRGRETVSAVGLAFTELDESDRRELGRFLADRMPAPSVPAAVAAVAD